MVYVMSSTTVGVFIQGLGMKFVNFCIFLNFLDSKWSKRLVATASTRGHVDQSDRASSLSPHALVRAPAHLAHRPLSPTSRPCVLQCGRERGDTTHSRWERAASPTSLVSER